MSSTHPLLVVHEAIQLQRHSADFANYCRTPEAETRFPFLFNANHPLRPAYAALLGSDTPAPLAPSTGISLPVTVKPVGNQQLDAVLAEPLRFVDDENSPQVPYRKVGSAVNGGGDQVGGAGSSSGADPTTQLKRRGPHPVFPLSQQDHIEAVALILNALSAESLRRAVDFALHRLASIEYILALCLRISALVPDRASDVFFLLSSILAALQPRARDVFSTVFGHYAVRQLKVLCLNRSAVSLGESIEYIRGVVQQWRGSAVFPPHLQTELDQILLTHFGDSTNGLGPLAAHSPGSSFSRMSSNEAWV